MARRQRGQLDPSAEKELVGADQQRPALTATSAAARTTAVRAAVTQNERKRSRRRYSPSIPSDYAERIQIYFAFTLAARLNHWTI